MIRSAEMELDQSLLRLEGSRDTSRDIVHIDMDAFYAAVEMRDNPALRNVPMAVGGSSMLSTSNYLARRHGVRAAMPGFIAKKLCPQLVIVPGNHEKYSAVSAQIMEVIDKYTQEHSAASLDEVYCDLTTLVKQRTLSPSQCPKHGQPQQHGDKLKSFNSRNHDEVQSGMGVYQETSGEKRVGEMLDGDGDRKGEMLERVGDKERDVTVLCWCQRERVVWNVVQEIRQDIENKTQLTASAGLSCNTFLAKVCSDLNKPNGQYLLPSNREDIMDFVAQLEIKKVPGIGRVQQALLTGLGIQRVSDIITNRGVLAHLFTPGTVGFYLSTALGLGCNQISGRDEGRSSMSTENTFPNTHVNIKNSATLTPEILAMLSELSSTLATRLKSENLAGETVSVKLKLATFEILQKSKTQTCAVSSNREIEFVTKELLGLLVKEQLVGKPTGYQLSARLLGVRVHKFVTSYSKQSSLLCFTDSSTLPSSVPASSQKTWECPVCGSHLPAHIASFNKHVDSCIATGDEPESSKGCKGEISDENETKEISLEGAGIKKHAEKCNTETRQRGEKRKSCETETSISKAEKWTCPVCTRSIAADLTIFNVHIERCLQKGQSGAPPESKIYAARAGQEKKFKSERPTQQVQNGRADSKNSKSNKPCSLLKYFERTC